MTVPTVDGKRGAAVRHAHRASGQVAALATLIADDRPFSDIAQQILAARGSLDSLLVRLVEIELQERVPAGDAREEVDDLLRTALGRNAPIRRTNRQRHSTVIRRSPVKLEGRTSP